MCPLQTQLELHHAIASCMTSLMCIHIVTILVAFIIETMSFCCFVKCVPSVVLPEGFLGDVLI